MTQLHVLDNETYTKCVKCSATTEECEDGISCGLVRCRECTLLRRCYGYTCEECRTNMLEAARKAYTSAAQDAFEKMAANIFNSAFCTTCRGTGEIDETLGGISTSNPHAPCPDCRS
jgi:hypothetical protein